jgi:hypothetical protein
MYTIILGMRISTTAIVLEGCLPARRLTALPGLNRRIAGTKKAPARGAFFINRENR